MEKERRELLSQQEETRLKMAALISAAASGKLTAENCSEQPPTDAPNTGTKLEDSTQHVSEMYSSIPKGLDTSNERFSLFFLHFIIIVKIL